MDINEFIGKRAEKRLQRIEQDLRWLLQYIEFLKGNRRANQNGLD